LPATVNGPARAAIGEALREIRDAVAGTDEKHSLPVVQVRDSEQRT
jgi:hypothetical protein